jgi:hypothetical protein
MLVIGLGVVIIQNRNWDESEMPFLAEAFDNIDTCPRGAEYDYGRAPTLQTNQNEDEG